MDRRDRPVYPRAGTQGQLLRGRNRGARKEAARPEKAAAAKPNDKGAAAGAKKAEDAKKKATKQPKDGASKGAKKKGGDADLSLLMEGLGTGGKKKK